jgi:citrate lyase subunit beta/citryl-CoA lyase
MGYDGKWAIHPAQIEVIHRAFAPTSEQIRRARAVVSAYEAAQGRGDGAIALEGEMIDAASLRVERRVLAIADLDGNRGVV